MRLFLYFFFSLSLLSNLCASDETPTMKTPPRTVGNKRSHAAIEKPSSPTERQQALLERATLLRQRRIVTRRRVELEETIADKERELKELRTITAKRLNEKLVAALISQEDVSSESLIKDILDTTEITYANFSLFLSTISLTIEEAKKGLGLSFNEQKNFWARILSLLKQLRTTLKIYFNHTPTRKDFSPNKTLCAFLVRVDNLFESCSALKPFYTVVYAAMRSTEETSAQEFISAVVGHTREKQTGEVSYCVKQTQAAINLIKSGPYNILTTEYRVGFWKKMITILDRLILLLLKDYPELRSLLSPDELI